MEQLPIEINGKRVYAGFWKRFLAITVDMLVSTPFVIIFYYLENISFSFAFFIVVLSSVFFSGYTVYFHYKFGAH